MQPTTPPTIFISYSRRQLYFAESLALYLQKESLDIWFDLQQLQAGTVWEDGLKEGINKADTLILMPIILILIFLPENRNAGLLLFILAISLLAFLTRNGWVWLPAFAKKNHDEIGINKVIFKTYRRKRIRILVVVFILMSSLGIYLQMSS